MLKRVEESEGGSQSSAGAIVPETGVTRAQAQIIAAEVSHRIVQHVQRLSLSRGGVADAVAGLGEIAHVRSLEPDVARNLMALFLGSPHAAGMVAARAARRARITLEQAEAALPAVFEAELGKLSKRAQPELTRIYGLLPALEERATGTMHGDLSLLVRDRQGAGAIGRRVLLRQVREAIVEAANLAGKSSVGWYVRQAFAPVRYTIGHVHRALMRPLV